MRLAETRYAYLSHRQREATPEALARRLIAEVRAIHRVDTVAVLWCQPRSIYATIEGADCWDEKRDARTYAGPHPVICHPPCGPWGSFAHWSKHHRREDALIGLGMVQAWGGVLEHPQSSRLWRQPEAAAWPSRRERIDQSDYGFPSRKPTIMYWVDSPWWGAATIGR